MSAKSNGSGRVRPLNDRVEYAQEPVHVVALAALRTKSERIRYACDQLGRPKTEEVRVWLDRYGIETSRSNTSSVVNAWRKERGLSDTGDLPAFTDEVLDEIASRQARNAAANAFDEPTGRVSNAFEIAGQESEQGAADVSRTLSRLGTAGAYLAAAVATAVSAETSLKFFEGPLQVASPVRWFLFGVMELALVACGVMMAAGVRSERGTPGPARWVAWGLCGFAVFAAMEVSGPLDGPLRAFLGPVLAVIMLHLALGMDFRQRHGGEGTGTLARIVREFRERFLSRLGLSDEGRDAVDRARRRAASRFAHLTEARLVIGRTARLRRLARISNLAHDQVMKDYARSEHAVVQNIRGLRDVQHESTW